MLLNNKILATKVANKIQKKKIAILLKKKEGKKHISVCASVVYPRSVFVSNNNEKKMKIIRGI